MKNDLISHIFSTINDKFDYYHFIGISKSNEDGESEICSTQKGDPDVVGGLLEAVLGDK